jgi:DNA repair exonuclease SbcCD ATPase subunit
MGSLVIKKITYSGKLYYYTSPELKMGLNILEGENGAGKTTFSDLICYGFGTYVRQYDLKKEIHKEIMNDTENYVVLDISIDKQDYKLTRHINTNTIIVDDNNGKIEIIPIYRSKGELIFSDWFLSKLQIELAEIHQGTKKLIINISDLFRLINYDQETLPRKIYKEHRTDGNFISDSLYIRKVIFEILTGYQFSEYYSLLGKLHKGERESDTAKSLLDNYSGLISQMGYNSVSALKEDDELSQLKAQLERINNYKERLKTITYDSALLDRQVQKLRRELIDTDNEFAKQKSNNNSLLTELKNLNALKEDTILEVTQLKKIIAAHEELNLFSQDTCPCCLRRVEREENYCICGAMLEDLQYEKFFYSSEEYLDILKSKQKSVETIDRALDSCADEKNGVVDRRIKLEFKHDNIKAQLFEIEKDIEIYTNDTEINSLNNDILEINLRIQKKEQMEIVSEKLSALKKDYETKKGKYTSLDIRVKKMESQLKTSIRKTITKFNGIYNKLMVESTDDILKAEINEDDYMPMINEGEYKQASISVPKRFMYFLTLLKMSILDNEMPFPRFLLIDTPENLGIDHENLEKVLSKIIEDEDNNYQVILTTGINKYPKEFKEYVFDTLTDDNKLLKKRV